MKSIDKKEFQWISIYSQLIFLLNFQEIDWQKRISIENVRNMDPPKQTYYWRYELLMGFPVEKLFGCCLFIGFNKAFDILGNVAFWGFKMKAK